MCHKVKFCSSIKITLEIILFYKPGIYFFLKNSIFLDFSKICILYGSQEIFLKKTMDCQLIIHQNIGMIVLHHNQALYAEKAEKNSSHRYFCYPSPYDFQEISWKMGISTYTSFNME